MSNQSNLNPWKIVDSEIIHATSWIEIQEDKCLADNQELTYTSKIPRIPCYQSFENPNDK